VPGSLVGNVLSTVKVLPMRAGDLAASFPTVRLDTPAVDASRLRLDRLVAW